MRRILSAVVMLVVLPTFTFADDNVYKKALKSTVWIVQPVSRDGNRVMLRTGSGSVIDAKQKLILTNYHVVEDIPDVTVCFPIFDKNGKLIPEKDKYNAALKDIGLRGKVIAKDPTKDLAIIKLAADVHLPTGTPGLRLAKESPDPSTRVHSIGSPGVSSGLFNYTDGAVKIVSQKQWKAMRMVNDPNPLQLNAKVIETNSGTNKGDSGGPLLNDKCELVGVTQGGRFGDATANPVAYFIAIEEVHDLLKRNKIKVASPAASSAVAADKPKDPPMTAAATSPADDAAKREAEAANKLEFAKDLVKAGKADKARERYQEIMKKYAGTKAAEEAKALLEKK